MGKQWETVIDFIFWGFKITADGDCSHEIKRHLVLGRRVMTNLDSILKSRDIPLLTKFCLVKAVVFPVVMYGCESYDYKESWAPKNWCFWTVCWRRLESSLDSKELQPVQPKGNHSEYLLKGLMLKLKLQYSDHLMGRTDSSEKTLMLGKIEGGGDGDDREWDGWMASLTQRTSVWVNSRSWWWTGRPGMLQFMGSQRVGHDWATKLKWTE